MPERDSATPSGRAATRPSQLRGKDWKAVLLRVWDNVGYHNIYLIAAGVAFFSTLALFPAIGALVAVYGLVSDPNDIIAQVRVLDEFLPEDAYNMVTDQVGELVSAESQTLSLASIIATVIALWSARAAVGALIDGVNITYSERNERGFLAFYGLTLLLTVVLVAVVVCAILIVVVIPAALQSFHVSSQMEWIAALVRWPVLLVTVMFGLGVLYRYGPQRRRARMPWVTWGSALATGLWLLGSLAFSWYVSNFADYNATYGSLGAVVGLMMWFFVGSYAVLLGAELNAEMEHQTARDSTTGRPKPIGKRGAYVADHLPDRSPERDEGSKDFEDH